MSATKMMLDEESDFWYMQANMLFVCISKHGINFTLNASLGEIENVANIEFIEQSEAVKGSIVSVMRTLLKGG